MSLPPVNAEEGGVTDLAERAIMVEAGEGCDILARDAGRILCQDERVCVGWVGHHQHLAA